MKTKLLIPIIIAGLSFGFLLLNPTGEIKTAISPPAPNTGNDFMIGVLESGAETGYDPLNDLKLNLWCKYTLPASNMGWVTSHNNCNWVDTRDAPLGDYQGYVNDVMVANANNNMKTMMMRPKIEYLAYGQRSDYRCVDENHVDQDYWFYSFQSPGHVGGDVKDVFAGNGSDYYVRYCQANPSSPESVRGMVVSGLKANREQCANSVFSSDYQMDSRYKWFIKPRIRVDADYVNNSSNGGNNICKIEVLNFKGDVIRTAYIKARNFRPDQFTNYDGSYLEEFHFQEFNDPDSLKIVNTNDFNPNGGNWWQTDNTKPDYSQVDFRVYWYGACDMWIDYVRVDNEVANDLLTNDHSNINWIRYNNWLIDEVQTIPDGRQNDVFKYYIEEFEFNNRPCMKYVNDRIKSLSSNQFSLMCDVYWGGYNLHKPNVWQRPFTKEEFKRTLVDYVGLKQIYMGSFPMMGYYDNGNPNFFFNHKVYIPSTLPIAHDYDPHNGFFCKTKGPGDYDTWLQGWLDDPSYDFGQAGEDRFYNEMANYISNASNIPWYTIVQTHLWYTSSNIYREPTNEEQDLLVNLPVSYGSKGILYFWYSSWGAIPSNLSDGFGRGLTNPVSPSPENVVFLQPCVQYEKRTANVYGQNKWNKVKDINTRLAAWGKYLMSFDNAQTKSYIYYLDGERNHLISDTYFNDLVTYKPGTIQPGNCATDAPDMDAPTGLIYDCNEQRFVQVATFQKSPTDGNQYFMIVNRRCAPYLDETNEDHRGGKRDIRIRFDLNSPAFPNYTNWEIINVADRNDNFTFSKSSNSYIDLKWFMPGEGKLYKIVPVLTNGGTLITDEVISGQTFTCLDTVWNNGHNITIGPNTNITFTDTSKIIMNGGTFLAGDANVSGSQGISFSSPSGGSHWFGYDFNNCNVQIYNTSFSNVANDTNFAVNIVDCPLVDIRGNTFDCGSDNLKGGINAVYYNAFATVQNIYIGGNTFSSANSSVPALNFMSYAGVTLPLIIENNMFTSGSNSGSTAILLTGVTGGAIKCNTITDFNIGVNLLSSSVDLYNNTISSSLNNSIGVYGTAGSEIKMNPSGGMKLGAANNISNTGTSTNNINVNNSYFYLDNGQNIFNTSEQIPSYHLKGYFPVNLGIPQPWSETYNCFNVNTTPVTPVVDVTDGDGGSQLSFGFTPYLTGCEPTTDCGSYLVCLGNGICDTLSIGCLGNGGGESSAKFLPLTKGQRLAAERETERGSMTTVTPKTMYDTICVLMRYHNYASAKTRCFNLIDTYTDSVQSVTAISKLFLALTASDTTSASMTTLKTFYENLILNHPGNIALIKRCNYFVQKCKVRLHQFSSALTGFQQIINQNPYSFEGLLAHWDYMATTLLMNGGAGGNSDLGFENSDLTDKDDWTDIGGDKSPFTKEQRGVIKQNINSAFETSKKRDEDKIGELEKESQSGNENAGAVLKQLRKMKEVIKPQAPKNIFEHIKIVRGDIQKIFGGISSNSKGKGNNLPTVFKLYQNYPNPFNPTATIRYDLPQNVKVNIKIYDLLGRQVKQLVDEFKQAGSYTVNFDGTNLASGVYFYRIEAGIFIESKKMILIK